MIPARWQWSLSEWATPTSCTEPEVLRFVGLANDYRKFVLRFSALPRSLPSAAHAPRSAGAHCPADSEQGLGSFDALKAALVSAPVLLVWEPARPSRLLTDASESGCLRVCHSGAA